MKNEIFKLLFLFSSLIVQTRAGAQTWQWAREETAGIEGYGVCCDNPGNVFLCGLTTATSVIGTYTNNYTGGCAVIVKYDPDGNVLWASFIPGAVGNNVACDAFGDVFLCGSFSSTIAIGSQTYAPQSNDIFLVKYSPSGTVLWSTTAGGAGGDAANSIAVDSQGNAIISGYIGNGTITIGTSVLTNTSGTKYFVAKYTNIGAPIWGICGASGTSQSSYICRDANDDLYLTGSYSNTTSIGTNTFITAGSNDFFLAKFGLAGNAVWSVTGGGVSSDNGLCVKFHPSGDVFVSGAYTSASFSLAATTLTTAGGYDAFLARYNSSGILQWVIKGGGTGNEYGYSLETHAGGAYFAGSMATAPMVIGTTTIASTGTSDNMFLCGIDNSGNVAYAQNINGGGDDVMALAMYNGCSLYLGGDILTPTLVLGAFTLTHTSSEVLFVAKFNTGINSPTLNLSPSYTLCAGNSLTLNASGANTYTWTGGPNTGSYVVSPATTNSYVVAGSSSVGCSTKSIVSVVVVPINVSVAVSSPTPFCTGNTATLSVAGASTYSWSTGGLAQSIAVTPSVTISVYNVSGISSTGCLYTSSQTLAAIASTPITLASPQTTICKGGTATLTASGANSYTWNIGVKLAAITVTPATTTIYSVSGTNSLTGCVSTASIQVKVNACIGIEENEAELRLLISPNPAAGEFEVQTEKGTKGGRLYIRNINGQIVYSQLIEDDRIRINKGLLPGVYILSIEQNGRELVCKKMLIQ